MKWMLLVMILISALSCRSRKYTLVHAISGYVYDIDNTPLSGVSIDFYDPDGIPFNAGSVTSSNEGYFFFERMWESRYQGLRAHRFDISYTIIIQKYGYIPDTVNLEKYVYEIDSINYANKSESLFDTIHVPIVRLKSNDH